MGADAKATVSVSGSEAGGEYGKESKGSRLNIAGLKM